MLIKVPGTKWALNIFEEVVGVESAVAAVVVMIAVVAVVV